MIEVVRESHAPADRLWTVMSEVRRWPDWLSTVTSVTPLEPGRPDEVGASYAVKQPGLPEAVWTITEVVPGRSFTWESSAPGMRSVGTHELRPGADGTTQIALGLRWSGALAAVVRFLVGRTAQHYVTTEAESLDRTAAEGA
ncbi:SRPBCC family protein [Oryzobacter telluris]|uniref:SRPBCC family protein n=1 Tax=Oryzobacter telluris TaxID=3149179 RepID=UPI00370D0997